MDMKKRYKIAYGSFFKWLIANLFRFLVNLLVPFFTGVFIVCILSLFNVSKKVNAFILTVAIIAAIFTVFLTFIPQYVELDSECIKVRRFICVGTKRSHFWGKYSFDIPYSEIIDIEWISGVLDYMGIRGRAENGPSFLSCDFNNTVLIRTTSSIGRYVISVKDSDDFYERVSQSIDRTKFLKELDIDDIIMKSGVDYDDLRLSWNGAEFNSVYYLNKNNNKITIAEFEYDKDGTRHIKDKKH